MINAGAITVGSLIRNDWQIADRFDYVSVHDVSDLKENERKTVFQVLSASLNSNNKI